MNKNHLIIFAKYPREGNVKTRLAATLGFKKATAIYRACADHIFREAEKTGDSTIHIFYADERDEKDIRAWTGGRFYYHAQLPGDLGGRMTAAFSEVLKTKLLKKDAKRVLIIGTDAPDISAEIVEDAFKKLEENDLVIGPAHDGGYYLLGMKKLRAELFTNIAWSTDTVFKSTMEIARQQNLSVAVLPELRDIDTEADLQSWIKGTPSHALINLVHEILHD